MTLESLKRADGDLNLQQADILHVLLTFQVVSMCDRFSGTAAPLSSLLSAADGDVLHVHVLKAVIHRLH